MEAFGVLDRTLRVAERGDEDALLRLRDGVRTDEFLDALAADGVVKTVVLGLDVDASRRRPHDR